MHLSTAAKNDLLVYRYTLVQILYRDQICILRMVLFVLETWVRSIMVTNVKVCSVYSENTKTINNNNKERSTRTKPSGVKEGRAALADIRARPHAARQNGNPRKTALTTRDYVHGRVVNHDYGQG